MSSPGLARSRRGMVTSPHALASRIGADVLEKGGNAVEATIAMVAALSVSHPHFCGLGGDAFFLVADAQAQVSAISGIGQAAEAADSYGGRYASIPVRGPASMLTSAGLVDALGHAYALSRGAWGGQCSWAQLLQPALGLAADGYAVSPSEHFWLQFRQDEACALAGVFAAFGVNGRAPEVGSLRRQPALARSLELLAYEGARGFYEGRLSAQIAAGLRAAGSPLTAQDLRATTARLEQPLRMAYRGGTLVAHPPPTQGVTTLQIMGLLERMGLDGCAEGSADHYHRMVEAVKRAFLDRNRWVADPERVAVPVQEMLSAPHLDAMAAGISLQQAMPWPHAFQTGDTVYVGAVDAAGRAACALATVYFDWGSGVVVGDTGILWHNRGAAFSLDPSHPNRLAPGKRPFHTLNPGMYLRDGKVRLLYGTQGADGQPQTLAAVLSRVIDFGMDPWTALHRPRFLLGKTFSDPHDSLKLERNIARDVLEDLASRGHQITLIDPLSPLMGHPGLIAIHPVTGEISGAHDPRSDGLAIGI